MVYKVILVGDGRQLLLPDANFQLEYRNGLRPAEAYATDFQMDPRFLCFKEDPKFEAATRKGVGKGKQYLANFFGPKRDSGDPISLIYFAIQVAYPKKLEETQGVDNILTAAGEVPAQLCINHEEQRPFNNFQKLPAHEKE